MPSNKRDPARDRYDRGAEREKAHKKQLPGEEDAPLPDPVEPIKSDTKPKRNEPCPCGSGKKYKQCCGKGAA